MPESKVQRRRLALLGATGRTGRQILHKLLQEPIAAEIDIHVYVRSRTKLESLFPSISSYPHLTIFHGSLNDKTLIRDCLAQVDTIICTLGENENIPGITSQKKTPRLLLLSSGTWNPRFAATRPALLDWMIRHAFARPYDDLIKAQRMLCAAPSLVSVLLIQPNALVEEAASGSVISTDFAHIAVSYEDLAEGFVQLATGLKSADDAVGIGVSSQRAERPMLYVPFVLGKVLRGLLFQFVPGYWKAEYAVSRFLGRSH
ncbi:hypothetical protein SI65_01458 [Aspergillus cristatus]|uniref:NAD(P)-binding domain-containing protein n=1 Tax=Aspergillus cristatus TaxID=573508 RepID=A0A1E3BSD8_ASPCR|nr:hypothetical protein SI65_01458 [Aspergillus cristatus]